MGELLSSRAKEGRTDTLTQHTKKSSLPSQSSQTCSRFSEVFLKKGDVPATLSAWAKPADLVAEKPAALLAGPT